ncbi:MAG: hypothetical protein PHP98_01160 [Kiritimatiellae bacterium]|nr:hypothetical protein [Kiritimatiellia bacterium]
MIGVYAGTGKELEIVIKRSKLSARARTLVVVFLAVTNRVWAQEAYILGGVIKNTRTHANSSALQLECLERLGDTFALSIAYLNEGHFSDHHRDGVASQCWVSRDVLDQQLSISAGIGPYFYCDTTSDSTADYINDHGVGVMTSLAANCSLGNRVFLQLRGNWVAASEINTVSLLVGIGYRFGTPYKTEPFPKLSLQEETTPRNEITVLAGRTIVNSFGSERSVPLNIEYRRKLWRHIEWTIAGLYEGYNAKINRYGPVSQFWVAKAFFNDRFALGTGAGCYYAFDRKQDAPYDGTFFAGIISVTARYQFQPHWNVRITLNRVLSDHNRDSDVLLGGIGYLF